jgi:hypothetical protein
MEFVSDSEVSKTELSPAAEKALDGWLGPSSWDSEHPRDMERWYHFIDQYCRDHGHYLNDSELIRLISNKMEKCGRPNSDYQYNKILKHVSLALDILRFLEYTGRWHLQRISRKIGMMRGEKTPCGRGRRKRGPSEILPRGSSGTT